MSDFDAVPGIQMTAQGPFEYLAVVGVTTEEVDVAQRTSVQHLRTLLGRKGLHQSTKGVRSSILARSAVQSIVRPSSLQGISAQNSLPQVEGLQ